MNRNERQKLTIRAAADLADLDSGSSNLLYKTSGSQTHSSLALFAHMGLMPRIKKKDCR